MVSTVTYRTEMLFLVTELGVNKQLSNAILQSHNARWSFAQHQHIQGTINTYFTYLLRPLVFCCSCCQLTMAPCGDKHT